MKILVTGMNKNQVTENFYLRQQLKVVPSHYSLLRCLRDMGHEVEQRIVKVGEDLSEYDRVICFLASPTQRLQLTFYNGLWSIFNIDKSKLILAFDDWKCPWIFKDIQKTNTKEGLLKDFLIGQNVTDPQISKEFLEPCLNAFDERRHHVVDKLNSIDGISCILPEGAFYAYPNVSGLIGKKTQNGKILNNDAEIVEWLLESAEVAAVPGVAFGLEPYFRVSYATSLEVLKEAMNRIEKAVLNLS